ncbi:MAG: tyrosine-type recombinase/integrase [Chloroflexi bacterium]|nr:tyrosine-type recombinase/integrase [Chloroflexota bacterium]
MLIELLFHLGCRISEVLALTTDDIDLEKGEVKILHLKIRIKMLCSDCQARLGRSHIFCPGCGRKVEEAQRQELQNHKQRILPVDNRTLELLREFIERGGPVLKKDGKRYLFGVNRHRAWQIVKQRAEKAGLPELINPETGKKHYVSPHRLRDAFAVHAVKADDSGDGLRLLQVHLGHASFDTTARYRKVAGEEHRRWYAKLWDKEAGNG